MLEIAPGIQISESDLHFDFVHSSGPGGQNMNKVSTAVQLRFAVPASSLPDAVKTRLLELAGKRVSHNGVLIIQAHRYRTQEQNREDAIKRLVDLVRKASKPPKARRATRPSYAARQDRVTDKKRRGEIKRLRRQPTD